MKKRILAAGILMLMFIVTACGNDELVETPVVTDISVDENGNPLEGYETWATAPDYKSTLITSSSIRYLSVTAGSLVSEANLTWFSPSETAGQVFWTSADDTDFANASVFDASSSASEEVDGYYINRAKVTDLTPGTDYLYRVGEGDNLSPSYTFHAPEDSDTLRFTAIGDPQLGKPLDQLDSQKNIWHKVLNKIKYHFPDSSLLVSLGDQVNNYDAQEAYAALLDQGVLYSMELAPVKGNHEQGGHQYSEHFTLPNLSTLGTCDDDGDGDYWFVRGNTLFMILVRQAEPLAYGFDLCSLTPQQKQVIVIQQILQRHLKQLRQFLHMFLRIKVPPCLLIMDVSTAVDARIVRRVTLTKSFLITIPPQLVRNFRDLRCVRKPQIELLGI